jgi:phosphoglycerol transferase MdoB-like AlkP superfamily enzyme
MVKSLFGTLLKHYVLWIILFAAGRLIFLVWNKEEIGNSEFTEVLLAFVHSLYLDTAMACYLLAIPFLLLLISALTQKPLLYQFLRWSHALLFFLFFVMTISELSIYDEWHTKLNYKALWFFGNPAEVFSTASTWQLISSLGGSVLLTILTMFLYRKMVLANEMPQRKPYWLLAVFALITPVVLAVGIRGGIQTIPINIADAYYSKNNFLNTVSVNSMFNLASSCIENSKAGEPLQLMTQGECDKFFKEVMTPEKDTTLHVLRFEKPNIVLVVLEGWSADMVESCNGFKGVTPVFDSLCNEGVLFTQCYATGGLSDQGMAAVFSAFPAQSQTSIITQPDKYEHLPCLNKNLKGAGYTTSFMFGGQLSYGNIRSYMYFNGFDKIIEGEDFDEAVPQGKLGAHDEYLFQRQIEELKTAKEPFFASMFTLSTHGPYDFQKRKDLGWGDKESDYVNSIYYADGCIGDFMKAARREKWFDETLFIFVSDHSHNTPKNFAYNDPAYRRIPMLFCGPAIDSLYRGIKMDFISSQTDLAATLLSQLNLSSDEFIYSKNLFNPFARRHAYFAYEHGAGWIEEDGYAVWNYDNSVPFSKFEVSTDTSRFIQRAKMFTQKVTSEYARY